MTTMKTLSLGLALALVASSLAVAGPGGGPGRGRHGGGRGMDRNQQWDAMLERLDTSGDGRISEAEFLARHERFEKLDRNDDGVVTEDELPQGRGGQRLGARLLERADANEDGRLTLAEWKAQRSKAFAKIDADGNGQVEKGEFMSFKPDRGGAGGPGHDDSDLGR